jgi:aminopeptidase N
MRTFHYFQIAILLFSFCNLQPACSLPVDTAHYYMKHSYDVQKYQLDMNIHASFSAPYPKSFAAKEIITLRVDSALNSIKLNAVNASLQIDSVRMAGVSFTHSSDTLGITLNRTYQPGEIVTVKICYQHKNISDNAFYASGGFVFTDFPPEGARKVFPCWDRPSDKALTDITVKVPLNVRLGSTGHLADSTVIADTITYHWVSEDPVSTYLMTITSKVGFLINKTWWKHLNDPNDSIPTLLYYKSGEVLVTANNLIRPLTDFFSLKFGEYPFEKIGFATLSSAFPWGGMENQTMVNLQPGGYTQEDLIAHEHSHQWFGDLITCGTWADIWLNEGFGTYCQKLWTENAHGYTTYKNQMNQIANGYLGSNPGWPVYNPGWAIQTPPLGQLYNVAVIYNKAACVLFQLRYVLGDSAFFNIMYAYATDTTFMFKNAVTEDFINKVNEVSGQDMQWFFDEWVYEPNHPVYSNTYHIGNTGTGSWQVSLTIEQIQTNTVFFRMPVEVKISFADASDTIVMIMNDANPQLFQWSFVKQPTSLSFDPNRNILLKQATTIVGLGNDKHHSGYSLDQNEPNPFTDLTTIQYNIPRESHVKISIFDSQGNEILIPVNKKHEPGKYKLDLTNEFLSPGIYLYKLEAGKYSESRKMIIVR